MATTTATLEVQHEVDRVVEHLQEDYRAIADAMVAAIQAEIPAYAGASPGVIEDVREHCRVHSRLIPKVAAANRLPTRVELRFAREAGARRVRQGIPLDALLQAFRVGLRTVWEAILEEADATPCGREAAIVLARPVMEYTDVASTQVAEAYLKEQQRLLSTADRERRDLLENLLAGRLPAPGERTTATELDPEADLIVAVACPGDAQARDAHALHHMAEALASYAVAGPIEPLVVVRQRQVVAVLPAGQQPGTDVVKSLQQVADSLRARCGIDTRVGLSTVCSGFQGVAHAYEQARQALRRTAAGRPVVALTEMTPFEYLVASADADTRRAVAEKGRLLLEFDCDGSAGETLLAYVAAGLSVKGAAERLFVHPNTVRYRLKKLSERTGRDIHSFEDLVDLVTVIRVAREQDARH
jgi:sugar diacid utilization regulator